MMTSSVRLACCLLPLYTPSAAAFSASLHRRVPLARSHHRTARLEAALGVGDHGSSEGAAAEPPSLRPPFVQLGLLLGGYAAHVGWLSSARVTIQGIPVAAENLVGGAVLLGYGAARRRQPPAATQPPWSAGQYSKQQLLQTVAALFVAYLLSGYASDVVQALLPLARPLSAAQRRAAHVLLSHLAWVAMASRVLGRGLEPFWPPPLGKGRWFAWRWRAPWLGWALGGYSLSLLGYVTNY